MKHLLIVLAAALAITACNQSSVEQLEWQRDSLALVNAQKDSSMALLATTMADVQTNLAIIKERENIIAMTYDGKEPQSSINSDIDAIYNLLLENKNKVARLQEQLNKVKSQSAEYQKVIDALQGQIEQQNKEIERLTAILEGKDVEIGYLNNAVISLSSSLDSLSTVNAQTNQQLTEATNKLNTAYYIAASKSELKELGVITSDGLFSKKVSADSESSIYTEVDIREFTELKVETSKVKMLSSHPSASFSLTQDGDYYTLTIKDAENFWSRSRYLVIQTK